MKDKKHPGAFERDTLYRMLVEASRYWVIEHNLRTGELPEKRVMWVYSNGPDACLDWGNAPRPDDPTNKPLRGKKIQVTLEVIDDIPASEPRG